MKIFISVLLIYLWVANMPLLAQKQAAQEFVRQSEIIELDQKEEVSEEEPDKVIKERKKDEKKKKGKRNTIIQPSEEDDENIILELDGN